MQNFIRIWQPVFEKWGLKIWGVAHFRLRPLPAPPGPKFLWDVLGHPKCCQMPLEFCQNLFPVASYGCLNISKIATLGVISRQPLTLISKLFQQSIDSTAKQILKKRRKWIRRKLVVFQIKVDSFNNFAEKSVLGEFDKKFDIFLHRQSPFDIDETCT